MVMDALEYKSSTFRGYAKGYQRPAKKTWLTKPSDLRAEAKHLRLMASDLDAAADEVESREAALSAEYGPVTKRGPSERRHELPPGQCTYCDSERGVLHPSHDASARCESGKRTHCTCDACF